MVVSAIAGLAFVAVGGIVGRSGWFSQIFALIALWQWYDPVGRYRVSLVGGGLVALSLGMSAVVQMVEVDRYSYIGWKADSELRSLYAASPDGMCVLRHARRQPPASVGVLAWCAICARRTITPHYGLRLYYKKDCPLINLPASAAAIDWANFRPCKALKFETKYPHNRLCCAYASRRCGVPESPGWARLYVGKAESAESRHFNIYDLAHNIAAAIKLYLLRRRDAHITTRVPTGLIKATASEACIIKQALKTEIYMAQIGDMVRYLNSVGGGRVVRIEGQMAYVDEDGFETPVLLRECVVVVPAQQAAPAERGKERSLSERFLRRPLVGERVERQEGESPSKEKPVYDPTVGKVAPKPDLPERARYRPSLRLPPTPMILPEGEMLNIVLAFEAEEPRHLNTTEYDAYIVNDSNYTLFLTYLTRSDSDKGGLCVLPRQSSHTCRCRYSISPATTSWRWTA